MVVLLAASLLIAELLLYSGLLYAAPLDFDLPTQSLSASLRDYGRTTGFTVAVDSGLVSGKIAPAVRGRMEPESAMHRLLDGSGLSANIHGTTIIINLSPSGTYIPNLKPGRADNSNLPNMEINLKETVVTAKRFKDVGPLPGLNLSKEQISGNIQTITAEEIRQAHSLSLTDIMNSKLQSVNVNDYQGNPFQMDVTYRGFTASPQIGTPQGLSVFFDGIRVNEPFGDVVNWDLIPMNAISTLDIFPGSNPLFGHNTLGGALSVKTKSGFENSGISIETLKGSYGREQLQASGGWNNGSVAAFGATSLFMEDGWRENSPSKVNQAFGKLEWQGERASLNLSTLGAITKLVGNGTVPLELYKSDPTSVFTSPDVTRNRLLQLQLSGAFDVTDTFNITGMVYNRSSKRVSSTGDIIDVETFRDLGRPTRRANPGELIGCAYLDADRDGFPDYYLDQVPSDGSQTAYQANTLANPNNPDLSLLGAINPGLPPGYVQGALPAVKDISSGGQFDYNFTNPTTGEVQVFSTSLASYDGPFSSDTAYFTVQTAPGVYTRYNVVIAPPANPDCQTKYRNGDATKLFALDSTGTPVAGSRDGAVTGTTAVGTGSGYVKGTPTGVITNSGVDQTTSGGGLQFNWNLEKHKFMVGLSLDRASAKYNASQRFGLLDANRNVYSDPANIGEEYYAASHDVPVNDFGGTSSTRSVYMSETWSPTKKLNFSFSSRYNITDITNTLAPRGRQYQDLTSPTLLNRFLEFGICPGSDLSECPLGLSQQLSAEEYYAAVGRNFSPVGNPITEKFTYKSFNPAIGTTWQANPKLNLYGSWNQGARVPSVIELGCAYDSRPAIRTKLDGSPILNPDGSYQYGEASIVDGRACSLPSVLSGDPYLPQVIAKTSEVGARGKFKDLLEWNLTAYRTDIQDDIYMVAATSQLSFFQSIGPTRRQGIEFGLAGEYGKSDFRLNFALTEATFQDDFKMLSANNSNVISTLTNNPDYNKIQVRAGNRMPGVPLTNANLSWGYKLTPSFKVRFSMVAHGESFIRGNENNEHTPGPGRDIIKGDGTVIETPDYRYSGKSPGYAVLNFRATYEIGKGWSAGFMVNNIFNKEYFSAGRLGLTPFAPSINGAIGVSGFNYNSSEWLSTQFMSAGAPRGVWFTIAYDFEASKKYDPPPSRINMTEPDRTLEPTSPPIPSSSEVALQKSLEKLKTVPVLRRESVISAQSQIEQQIAETLEQWRLAKISGNTVQYFASYSPEYTPSGFERQAWEQDRKLQMLRDSGAGIEIRQLAVAPQGKQVTAVFVEKFSSPQNTAFHRKMLDLEQRDGRWLIVRESELPVLAKHKAAIPSPAATKQKVISPAEVWR